MKSDASISRYRGPIIDHKSCISASLTPSSVSQGQGSGLGMSMLTLWPMRAAVRISKPSEPNPTNPYRMIQDRTMSRFEPNRNNSHPFTIRRPTSRVEVQLHHSKLVVRFDAFDILHVDSTSETKIGFRILAARTRQRGGVNPHIQWPETNTWDIQRTHGPVTEIQWCHCRIDLDVEWYARTQVRIISTTFYWLHSLRQQSWLTRQSHIDALTHRFRWWSCHENSRMTTKPLLASIPECWKILDGLLALQVTLQDCMCMRVYVTVASESDWCSNFLLSHHGWYFNRVWFAFWLAIPIDHPFFGPWFSDSFMRSIMGEAEQAVVAELTWLDHLEP